MEWEDSSGLNPNLAKFLNFLGKAEGANYNTIVGGSSFSDFSQHPNVVGLRTKEGPSTASGRYQITKTTYNDIAPALGITDFSQNSQDLIATELIRRKNALGDVINGNFDEAVKKLGGVWASLPSSPYSQPKRDWNFVKANLTADAGWEDAPSATASNGGGWEDAPAAPATAPVASPQAAAKAPAPEKKKEEPRSVLRRVDDFVRGVADTVTFGYADEIAAKMDALVGGGQSGKTNYKDAVAAQRERDAQGGAERIAGQIGGAFVPGAAAVGAVRAVPTAGRMARAGAGAATGAIQGGLYGSGSAEEGQRLEGAAKGALTGAAVGGVLGGVLPASQAQKSGSFIKNSGDEAAARLDAEIITDIKKIADSQTKRGNPVTAIDLNAVEGKYINEVNRAVTALGKVDKNFDAGPLRAALQDRRALTPDDLAPLRNSAAGNAVADAIEKAQRARSLTQSMQSSGGLMPLLREGVDLLPLPAFAQRGLKAALGGRQTREVAAQKALKEAETAQNVLERLGPSSATKSSQELLDLVAKAQSSRQAQVTAGQQARVARVAKESNPQVAIADLQSKDPTYILGLGNRLGAPRNANEMAEFSKVIQAQMEDRAKKALSNQEIQKLAKDLAKGPQVDPRIKVLQDTRRPLSGAFQEFLQGGRSGLNLTGDQAIDALRLTSRQFKDRPVGQAAQDILRSGNVKDEAAFYGLQNQLRKLQEQGVLAGQPGALSAASSGIRNPVSYAEAVRTAGEAANLARASAPNKELAQFATKVAGIKSPADKAKAVADRLAKSNDPAEQAFLTQFVEPLTQFGKK